ncbi:MAG TPA: ABC transporter permease [Thermoanaerobaculia bacterium]|nr:ABC transporter permease [Thermoanaerobaculia bacterium]
MQDTFWQDLRYGVRKLLKEPGLSALCILTLALGIGLTTTMYSIVHGVLRDLPFEKPEQLLHVERSNPTRGIRSMPAMGRDFLAWREQQSAFQGLSAFYTGTANLSGTAGEPERYAGAFLTPDALDTLKVKPLLGRGFRPEDGKPASPAVVILGHSLWQKRFRGDAKILGQTVRINGETPTVIGVMPAGFEFPVRQDLWLPLRLDPAEIARGEGPELEVFGRLKEGESLEQARAELTTIAGRLGAEHPKTNQGVLPVVKPYTEEYTSKQAGNMLYVMLGAVFGVLLIACSNVMNLLLARAAVRSREVAIRSALGASRSRLIVQLLVETFVLSLGGALLGLGLAGLGVRLFRDAIAGIDPPYWIKVEIDPAVVLFVFGLTLLASLLSGIIPSLKASGGDAGILLKDESRGSTGLRIGRFSRALVIAEVALSCGLLVAAGLMIKSVINQQTKDYGFATREVLTAKLDLESDYASQPARLAFFESLQQRLAAAPGVQSAALTSFLPANKARVEAMSVEGTAYARDEDRQGAYSLVVTPGFFATLNVPVQGREFGSQDRRDGQPVMVVNQTFAKLFLPGGNPIGKRVRIGPADSAEPWRTVVGVVPDLYVSGPENKDPEGMYIPLAQSDAKSMALVARAAGDPLALTPAVRREVAAIDPYLPLYGVDTLAEVIRKRTWFVGVFGALFMAFGFAALFLATVGLYGVLAFSVSRRTQEVGIRMALGAQAGEVLRLIFRQGATQLAVGMALGLALGLGLSKLLQAILFGVEPWDPTIFIAVALVLGATGAAACLIPARRAAKVDPMMAMRYE